LVGSSRSSSLGGPLEVAGLEAQALQHGRRFQLDAVAVVHAEAILQIAVAVQHRVVLGLRNRLVAEPVFQRVHFGFHRQQLAECARRFVEHRTSGVVEAVLRQVADGQSGRLEDGAFVGLVEPGHHLEERGLARAVGSAEADALPIRDLPRDVVEEDAVAEGLGEV